MMPGVQFEEVWKAFYTAYSKRSLEQMLRFRLNIVLDDIVADGPMRDMMFDLLSQAEALLAKHKEGVDVRIIIRGEFAPVGPLEQFQRRGFDMSKVRLQNCCHTQGIIVDGTRVLIGSHN
jgi:hypothetical protein